MGGGDSYSWNFSGSLPDNLIFSNGQISGTVQSDTGCSNPPPYSFTVQATSCGMTAFKGYVLTVIDPDCSSAGSGSGSGGSCSSIRVYNTGDERYYRQGLTLLSWCVATGSCNPFISTPVPSGQCIFIYRDFRCRRLESVPRFDTLMNYDTNNNCEVNYNEGRLYDR
ncbi:MAG: hypothetical protein Q9M89_09745 [Persephonella sp.]|nr:hypothetical protein [Persephonella sp.]